MELKKVLSVILAIFLGLIFIGFVFVSGFAYNQKQKSPVLFRQGLEFYSNEDYQNAYYNFSRIYPNSNLYLNALYYQAKCADILSDKNTAIKKYLKLANYIKNDNATPFMLYRAAQLSENNPVEAKKIYSKLNQLYPESEYGIAANYQLSRLTVDSNKKCDYLLKYIKHSSKGRYANDVLLDLLSNDFEMDSAQKVLFANALYENGAYNRTISVLKDVPLNLSWVLLIKALDKIHSPQNVSKIAKKAFLFDNSNFDEESLIQAVSIYAKNSEKGYFNALEEVYLNASDRCIKMAALYNISQYFPEENAQKYKAKFFENYPNSKFAPQILYELFIYALKNNKAPLAIKYANSYIALYQNEQTPVILYFAGYLKKKIADVSYKNHAQKLLEAYPYSYYTYLAYKNLLQKDLSSKRGMKIFSMQQIPFVDNTDKKLAGFFENFTLYNDFTAFDDFRIKDLLIKSWIEYKKGNKALSSVYARDYIKKSPALLKRSDYVWKLAYPVYYEDKINEYAQNQGLDPYLILALIKEESHFNSNVISSAGAAGLMQIMPSTARMLANKDFSQKELTEVNLNIKLGTKYFSELMQIFSNNEPLCVLSYNSGPNAVKRWIENNKTLPFDIFVETIPYEETKNYIKKVYGAYWNYLLTYGGIKIKL